MKMSPFDKSTGKNHAGGCDEERFSRLYLMSNPSKLRRGKRVLLRK
jgi:hypothetical protein